MISGHVASLVCFICPSLIKGDKRVEETPNWDNWENVKVKS